MDDATSVGTRRVEGVDLPAPGMWRIDPGHADAGFVGRRFGLSRVRGRFGAVDGTVTIADDLERSTVEVTITMASVETGSTNRDESLRSANLFDVERYPTARFRSTAVEPAGHVAKVIGDLTLKGVTRPVILDLEYLGYVRDPFGIERAIFRAAATINREAWGMTWNMVLETGGLAVSKDIRLEIEVELIRS